MEELLTNDAMVGRELRNYGQMNVDRRREDWHVRVV